MSSIGAYTGAVGAGTYSATKGALEGMSLCRISLGSSLLTISILLGMVDCLREEISPFGIECCLITPGYYRTDIFAPTHIKFGPPSIPDYAEFNTLYKGGVQAMHHTQQGDPRRRRIVSWTWRGLKARLPAKLYPPDFLWVRTRSKDTCQLLQEDGHLR